jgi:hypothetical protein
MNFPWHREHLITAALWSAPAERSGDGAFVREFHVVTGMICTLFRFNVLTFQRFNVWQA